LNHKVLKYSDLKAKFWVLTTFLSTLTLISGRFDGVGGVGLSCPPDAPAEKKIIDGGISARLK